MTQMEFYKIIKQENLDKELVRHSLFYWLQPKDPDVRKVLIEKGFLERRSRNDQCKLTIEGSTERFKAEKRLESVGR